MLNSNYVGSGAYEQYSTIYPGPKEVVNWFWWDTQIYISGVGGSTVLNFFQVIPATKDLGNMLQAGQFPAPFGFMMRAIRFHVKQQPQIQARAATGAIAVGAVDNIQQLTNDGVLVFRTGSKDYGEHPLWMVPAGAGMYGMLAVSGNIANPGGMVDWAINGAPDVRNAYSLGQPLFIPPLASFSIQITWPAAITLAGGNTPVTVVLDGDLIRPVQ
jgi:hypothetical protein